MTLPMSLKSLLTRPAFWIVALAIVAAVGMTRLLARPQPAGRAATPDASTALRVMGTIPDFALTDQNARPFGAGDLRGKVWIADFIFTRCPSICPVITAKLREVQERTADAGDAVRLVSFSVDPAHDTPAVLATYAAQHRVDPRRWSFVTGSYTAMRAVVEQGLKQLMDQNGNFDDPASVMHSPYFVLVDQGGQLRGFYDSNDADAVDRLVRDTRRLLAVPQGR